MSGGAPRVTKWVPYVCIGVPICVGVLLSWLLPDTESNFWVSLVGFALTYLAMREALRRLFVHFGLD